MARVAATGAAGVNLEDGRADGTLRDAGLHAEIVAAVKERAPDVFVNARTDVWWLGSDRGTELKLIAAALSRAEAYTNAGADGVFVPGVGEDESIAALAQNCGAPLNVVFMPGRQALPRLAELGVARVSLGSLLYRAAMRTVADTVRAVRAGRADPAPGAPSYAWVARLVTGTAPSKS